MVVMAIIPFGLVGTIWGHNYWDVPLSMFTVVGLLGMTGIIINDSIVLVTTIDEHAKERGMFASIVEGACDRLRPVMLTTLTTVLGLTPLLFERSAQAQFLMPTVITLVYGLGFGMLLVLLVVPALIAAQQDIARQMTALRHGLKARATQVVILPLGAAILAWLIATVGWIIAYGGVHPIITELAPALASVTSVLAGLGLFMAGVLAAILIVYAVAAVALNLKRRQARA